MENASEISNKIKIDNENQTISRTKKNRFPLNLIMLFVIAAGILILSLIASAIFFEGAGKIAAHSIGMVFDQEVGIRKDLAQYFFDLSYIIQGFGVFIAAVGIFLTSIFVWLWLKK